MRKAEGFPCFRRGARVPQAPNFRSPRSALRIKTTPPDSRKGRHIDPKGIVAVRPAAIPLGSGVRYETYSGGGKKCGDRNAERQKYSAPRRGKRAAAPPHLRYPRSAPKNTSSAQASSKRDAAASSENAANNPACFGVNLGPKRSSPSDASTPANNSTPSGNTTSTHCPLSMSLSLLPPDGRFLSCTPTGMNLKAQGCAARATLGNIATHPYPEWGCIPM